MRAQVWRGLQSVSADLVIQLLSSVWPTGIPPEDYGQAVERIAAMGGLLRPPEGKRKRQAVPVAPEGAATEPHAKRGPTPGDRGGKKERILRALSEGPADTTELAKKAGVSPSYVMMVLRAAGARSESQSRPPKGRVFVWYPLGHVPPPSKVAAMPRGPALEGAIRKVLSADGPTSATKLAKKLGAGRDAVRAALKELGAIKSGKTMASKWSLPE